jgi:hypothetical protein
MKGEHQPALSATKFIFTATSINFKSGMISSRSGHQTYIWSLHLGISRRTFLRHTISSDKISCVILSNIIFKRRQLQSSQSGDKIQSSFAAAAALWLDTSHILVGQI